MSDEIDPSRAWVKTRDGSVSFGLVALTGFEADDGTVIRNEDIVDSSEPALPGGAVEHHRHWWASHHSADRPTDGDDGGTGPTGP